MFDAISQIFRAIFVLARATENAAHSFNALTVIARDEAEGLADQLTLEREARIQALTKTLSGDHVTDEPREAR